jgi:hypothetical protein
MSNGIKMLCLANSTKYEERCLAGLRLDTGGWIRPVSDAGGSALVRNQYTTQSGHVPEPLDTVKIKVKQQHPKYNQPENWIITGEDWELVTTELGKKQLLALNTAIQREGPVLFNSERIIPKHKLQELQIGQSLTLLRPDSTQFYSEIKSGKRKPYTKFKFDGDEYNLSITDHNWREAVDENGESALPSSNQVGSDQEILYTISLAQANDHGACFKLVAAVFALDSDKIISL